MPHRPVILGVAGDSATGKTTVAIGVANLLGSDDVTLICTDDYHRYSRSQRRTVGVSPLHPDGNNIEVLEQHLQLLAQGQPILKPVYNHATGEFDEPQIVEPRRFVIIEGLLGFATPSLRQHPHLKIFLDPPEELRRQWKISRDTSRRGYTQEQVLAEMRARESDSAEFIRPQRHWADMIVRFLPDQVGQDNARLNAQLILRPSLPPVDLGAVFVQSSGDRPALRERVGRDEGRLTEILEIDGHVTPAQAAVIEQTILARLPKLKPSRLQQLGSFEDGALPRRSYSLGLVQLLIAYHLLLVRNLQDSRLADHSL